MCKGGEGGAGGIGKWLGQPCKGAGGGSTGKAIRTGPGVSGVIGAGLAPSSSCCVARSGLLMGLISSGGVVGELPGGVGGVLGGGRGVIVVLGVIGVIGVLGVIGVIGALGG